MLPAAIGLLLVIIAAAAPAAAAQREHIEVAGHLNAALDELELSGDFARAQAVVSEIFDSVVAYVDLRRPEAFIEAAHGRRLVGLLAAAKAENARDLLPFLRRNRDFARALVFLARPDEEDPAEIIALADRLRRERGDKLNEYAFLAAAICVVHDKPITRRYNENRVTSPDPVALFDFYLEHESRMFFGLKSVPSELLVHVVDVTAPIDELQWAVQRYAGDPMVGARYFDVRYDREHFRTGAPKKSTQAGWGLRNILQYGGVCADQAYFAATVGKAIGVPACYTVGRSAEVGHAWVGFLQADRNTAWWNFNLGRYGAYLGLRGDVWDPQIRRSVPESSVSLTADFALSKKEDRYAAAALTDAALRLIELERAEADASGNWPPADYVGNVRSRRGAPLREPVVAHQLPVLEAALRSAAGYAPAWFALADLSGEGRLALAEKRKWADLLRRLCGPKYPDFALEILRPMIASIEDVNEQNGFWNRAFNQFQNRHDLCAEIRMEQAAMWEAAGEFDRAGQCYMDVIERYANAGPFVFTALRRAERLLVESGRKDAVVALYSETWSRIDPPDEMAGHFLRQSNWYRVGVAYAERLDEAGQSTLATEIRGRVRGAASSTSPVGR